jgi:monoamine oxidase
MKTKLGIVILVVVCVGLVIALVVGKKQADTQRKKDADAILDFSNQLTTASASLDELRQVNLMLTNDLAGSRQEALARWPAPKPRSKAPRTKSPVSTAVLPVWKHKIRRWISVPRR